MLQWMAAGLIFGASQLEPERVAEAAAEGYVL